MLAAAVEAEAAVAAAAAAVEAVVAAEAAAEAAAVGGKFGRIAKRKPYHIWTNNYNRHSFVLTIRNFGGFFYKIMFSNFGHLRETGTIKSWPVDISELESWLLDFICKPNKNLTHSRAICPCAISAVNNKRILLEHVSLRDCVTDKKHVLMNKIIEISSEFKRCTSDEESSLDCLLITLDGLYKHEYRYVIDGAYLTVKEYILKQKLMIGGFHPYNNRPSRYNLDFFPMRPNLPVIAMRHMAQTDLHSLSENQAYISIYRSFYPE